MVMDVSLCWTSGVDYRVGLPVDDVESSKDAWKIGGILS